MLGDHHLFFSKRSLYLHPQFAPRIAAVLDEGIGFYKEIVLGPKRSLSESNTMADKQKRLDEKDAQRLRLLDAIYELTDGDTRAFTSHAEAYERAGLSEDDGTAAEHFLAQAGLLQGTVGLVSLTHEGVDERERAIRNRGARTDHFSAAAVQNVFNINVSNSVIGAVATGDNAQAHGTVRNVQPITQSEYLDIIKRAQTAVVHDQETLDRIDDLLYEGLNQILRNLRRVQIEQTDLAGQVAKMKATVEELWVTQAAESLRGHLLPEGLEVIKALGTHVVTGVVVELLRGR